MKNTQKYAKQSLLLAAFSLLGLGLSACTNSTPPGFEEAPTSVDALPAYVDLEMDSSESRFVADHDGSMIYLVTNDKLLCMVVVPPEPDERSWVSICPEHGKPTETIAPGSGRFLYSSEGPSSSSEDYDRWLPLGKGVYVFT